MVPVDLRLLETCHEEKAMLAPSHKQHTLYVYLKSHIVAYTKENKCPEKFKSLVDMWVDRYECIATR